MPITGYKVFGPNYSHNGYKCDTDGIFYDWFGYEDLYLYTDALKWVEYYTTNNTYAIVSSDFYRIDNDKVICTKLKIEKKLSYEEFGTLLSGTVISDHGKKSYVNGKLHGENIKIYYDNECTKIMSIGNYKEGVLYGKYNEYDENNNLSILCEYTNNGLLDGIYSKYTNGKISYEITYELGVKNGATTYYYNNLNDINDELNGRIQKIEMYKEDMLNGFITEYNVKSRNPLYDIHYVNGLKDGKSTIYIYDENDNLINKIESEYKENKLYNGVENIYYDHKNMKLKSSVTYVNGMKNGVSKKYYENGNVSYEINYENDVLNGISKSYDINGNITCEENYENGVLNGTLIKYIYKESIKNISISGVKKEEKKIDVNKSYSYAELLKDPSFFSKKDQSSSIKKDDNYLQLSTPLHKEVNKVESIFGNCETKRRGRDMVTFRRNQFSDFGVVEENNNDNSTIEEQFNDTNFEEHKNMMNDEDPFIRKIKEFSFM